MIAVRSLACLAAAAAALSACESDSFLSGQWFEAENGTDLTATNGEGFVELNLGHYGEDVVGVIRFFPDRGRVPKSQIYCAFVNGRYDADSETLHLVYEACDKTLRKPVVRRLNDDKVSWSDAKGAADSVTIDRTKSDSELTIDDKACTPCP